MLVLLACFPKSGSTTLSDRLAAVLGARADFVPAYGRREQELQEDLVRIWRGRSAVAQHHVTASRWTLDLCEAYDVRPLVLVRNLADALVSLHDHAASEGPDTPVALLEQGMSVQAVADVAAAWYIKFYVSWYRAAPEAIVTYEDVVLGGNSEPIRQRLGVQLTAPDGPSSRFNVGRAGRGQAIDPDLILRLTRHYPDVDFRPIL